MIECIVAWVLLICGIFTQEAEWFIASGVFAVALQIHLFNNGGKL